MTEEPMGFPCLQCGRVAVLIRGLCAGCAPQLHADYAAQMEAFEAMDELFFWETGHHALDDWYGFEAFVARHYPDPEEETTHGE